VGITGHESFELGIFWLVITGKKLFGVEEFVFSLGIPGTTKLTQACLLGGGGGTEGSVSEYSSSILIHIGTISHTFSAGACSGAPSAANRCKIYKDLMVVRQSFSAILPHNFRKTAS
jgi:hypothetical protein